MDNKNFTDTYQTGSTTPPKSHRGLVALLLVLVIFLCGIATGLGLMNIQLFRQLKDASPDDPLAFSQDTTKPLLETHRMLGFCTKDISEFWQIYQDIPRGLFITDVDAASDAAAKGILPGDILLQIDEQRITDTVSLEQWISAHAGHSSANVLIFRNGQQITVTLTLN